MWCDFLWCIRLTADHLCLDSAVVVVSTCTVSTSGPLLSCLDRTCPSSPPKSGPPVFSLAGHVGGTWRRMRAMRLVPLHRASRGSQPYACEACGCFLALYEREIGMELLAGPVGRVVALRRFSWTTSHSTQASTAWTLATTSRALWTRCRGAGAHVSARVSCAQYPLR